MQIRGRPKKYRIVKYDPKISHFSPRGRPGRPDEVNLAMDEFEAMRLADFMGLGQKEAAKSMHVSQQTFSRIIKRARKSLITGLINGATIKIQGGQYIISSRD
ncbi:MAG: DUF134 domain-containing protein [Candidatus Omnitrophica bacterium]|jgi:predicted DNA-binding protein (UPF0251 family)|nr:DUF134 domain-containing protein [Candidatus Omnitrophota bacterium]